MASVYHTRAGAWIYGLLANDTTESDPNERTVPLSDQGIGPDLIFDYIATASAPIYVVYQYQGGFDVLPNGRDRLFGSLLFAVKVSGEGNTTTTLEPIADRIDKLLGGEDGTAGDTPDGYHIECVREQELALPPVVDGDVITREIGGLYRLQVHRLP